MPILQKLSGHRAGLLRHLLIPVLFLASAAIIFLVLKATRPQPPAQPVKTKHWPVSVLQTQPQDYTPQTGLLGRIESPYQTTLTAAISGYVDTIQALEGDTLPANSTLIRLDPRDTWILLQQRDADLKQQQALVASEQLQHRTNQKLLQQDQALLQLLQANVQRLQTLYQQKSASQASLEETRQAAIRQKLTVLNRQMALDNYPQRIRQLKAGQSKAAAAYRQAQLDLERTEARVPYNARVAALHVAPGDRVTPGKPLAELYPTQALEVRAQLPSHLLQSYPDITALTASLDYRGKTYPLALRNLGARVQQNQSGVDALFRFVPSPADTDNRPPVGQSVPVTLYLPDVQEAIALPGTAFYGQNRIYSVQQQRLVSHNVTRLGRVHQGFSEPHILVAADSLPDQTPILITQLPNAISGLPVVITETVTDQKERD